MSFPKFSALGAVVLVAACSTNSPIAPAMDAARSDVASVVDNPVVASATGSAPWRIPSGPLAGQFRRFTFNALKHLDGTTDGTWELIVGPTILHGTITCLELTEYDGAPAARIGARLDAAKFSTSIPGTDVAWLAVDGGEGANAVDLTSNPQAFRNAPAGSASAYCASGTVPSLPGNPPFSVQPTSFGNVQIHE